MDERREAAGQGLEAIEEGREASHQEYKAGDVILVGHMIGSK